MSGNPTGNSRPNLPQIARTHEQTDVAARNQLLHDLILWRTASINDAAISIGQNAATLASENSKDFIGEFVGMSELQGSALN